MALLPCYGFGESSVRFDDSRQNAERVKFSLDLKFRSRQHESVLGKGKGLGKGTEGPQAQPQYFQLLEAMNEFSGKAEDFQDWKVPTRAFLLLAHDAMADVNDVFDRHCLYLSAMPINGASPM